MSIPNPYPNIADKEKNDVKTWSSAKIMNELQPALDTELTSEEIYEGNIVTFNNNLNNKEITSLECEILPIQEGTGDPSPSNPRPISGFSTVTISHSGADTSDPAEIEIALGQTVYEGSADVVGGSGEVTWERKKIRELGTFIRYSNFFSVNISNTGFDSSADFLCETFNNVGLKYDTAMAQEPNYSLGYSENSMKFRYDDSADVNDFLNAVGDSYIVHKLTTPTPYTFTGQPIESFLGVNNIWADTDNIKVTVSETRTIGDILKERGILP